LQIRAVFPDGDVLIDQFTDLKQPANGKAHSQVAKNDGRQSKAAVAS
jgi:hypothetical protein